MLPLLITLVVNVHPGCCMFPCAALASSTRTLASQLMAARRTEFACWDLGKIFHEKLAQARNAVLPSDVAQCPTLETLVKHSVDILIAVDIASALLAPLSSKKHHSPPIPSIISESLPP